MKLKSFIQSPSLNLKDDIPVGVLYPSSFRNATTQQSDTYAMGQMKDNVVSLVTSLNGTMLGGHSIRVKRGN